MSRPKPHHRHGWARAATRVGCLGLALAWAPAWAQEGRGGESNSVGVHSQGVMVNGVRTLSGPLGFFVGGAWIDRKPQDSERELWSGSNTQGQPSEWVARAALHLGLSLRLGPHLLLGAGYGGAMTERAVWHSDSQGNRWRERGFYEWQHSPVLLLNLGPSEGTGIELLIGRNQWGLAAAMRR